MSKSLGPCVRPSASAIAPDATLNAVTIAVGRRWGACTSTRTMRGGSRGMASGPARTIANAWASTTTVIQTFSIGCSRIAFGMPTRNGGSGNSERPLSNFARFAQVLHRSGLLQRVRLVVGARRHQNKRRALRWRKSRARQRRQ
jgi:hypothetical protein